MRIGNFNSAVLFLCQILPSANVAFLSESSYAVPIARLETPSSCFKGSFLRHFRRSRCHHDWHALDTTPLRRQRIAPSHRSHSFNFSSVRLYAVKRRTILSRLRGGAGASVPSGPPPLTSWIGPALSCGLSYALYNLFIKRASSLMDPMLGGVLLQCVAAMFGAGLWAVSAGRKGAGTAALITRGGAGWSVAAGISVGLAEILSFVISSRGVPAVKSIPVVVGGSVWFGTVLAAVWLRERVSWRGWAGILLISAGIGLVGIDPSSASSGH
jgi:transporter family protein